MPFPTNRWGHFHSNHHSVSPEKLISVPNSHLSDSSETLKASKIKWNKTRGSLEEQRPWMLLPADFIERKMFQTTRALKIGRDFGCKQFREGLWVYGGNKRSTRQVRLSERAQRRNKQLIGSHQKNSVSPSLVSKSCVNPRSTDVSLWQSSIAQALCSTPARKQNWN